jgi:large subunit ribosomal protein L4
VFAAEVNEVLMWEQVKAQRASRRRGTHSTKTRANVRGGGAKPFK